MAKSTNATAVDGMRGKALNLLRQPIDRLDGEATTRGALPADTVQPTRFARQPRDAPRCLLEIGNLLLPASA